MIFLGDFSFVRIFLKNYRVTMTITLDTSCQPRSQALSSPKKEPGNEVDFMFGKYNGFVSKARVSACMYFLVFL